MASDQETRPEIGSVAKDLALKGKVGIVMGEVGGRVQLRPLRGGIEWETDPHNVVPADASEALSARVAAENDRSRWGL